MIVKGRAKFVWAELAQWLGSEAATTSWLCRGAKCLIKVRLVKGYSYYEYTDYVNLDTNIE